MASKKIVARKSAPAKSKSKDSKKGKDKRAAESRAKAKSANTGNVKKSAKPAASSSKPKGKTAPVAKKSTKAVKTAAVAAKKPASTVKIKANAASDRSSSGKAKASALAATKTVETKSAAPAKVAVAEGVKASSVASLPAPAAKVLEKAAGQMAKPTQSAASPTPPAKPVVAERGSAPAKTSHRTGFRTNEFIVYPAHGVGQIIAIEEQEVAGFKLELFVINFTKDKMTLKVPMPKVLSGAIRKLAEPDLVKRSLDILTGRARIKRTMWSRRAQEYESKINSGDLAAIAEVVRDLFRSDAQPEQSYSERQLYEAALDRMAREIAAVHKVSETEALKTIEGNLLKGPKRGAKTEAADPADVEVVQAA